MTKILLVEDSPADANLLRQVFSRASQEDWQIEEVERLSDAIALFCEDTSCVNSNKFDVVLLDLRLPDSTGIETVKNFRKAVFDIAIVVLTGVNDEELALQAMSEGAQDYLVKDDISLQNLMRAIRHAIEREQILKQLRESEHHTREALIKEQEINKIKSHFIAKISHELRNPMSTIRYSIDSLQFNPNTLSEEKRTKNFEWMNSAINQMIKLLDEILFISKSESGKVQLYPIFLDLVSFCREAVETIQFRVGKQHNIIFNSSSECIVVKMDRDILSCIFTNLLSNAIKYSPEASDVCFDLISQDDLVIFRIQDKGIGIPLSDQIHLFENFYRARNVSKIEGTGLGLAIVKKCVELQGGKIAIDSQEGVGTTVIVTLPQGLRE
jgi:signal transduction histidine kinase